AHDIYAACNRRLQQGMRPQEIIRQSNVKLLCTTDDPVDDLIYHHQLRQENTSGAMILPAWRPDKALNLSLPTFAPWLARLEAVTAQRIDTFEALQEALTQRALFFHEQGCRLSDHGMDTVPCEYASMAEVETAFAAGRAGKPLTQRQVDQYRTALLVFLAGLYRNLGWTMQLHIGATRNVNHARAHVLGPDTGFDAMGDTAVAQPLEGLLNAMAQKTPLPRTILFNIHAKDNYTLATLAGTFQQDGVAAQVQHGPAWWFHDQRDGMLLQMTNLANVSLLSEFIGMTTDSRSLLSYTRHAYFRWFLCNLLGEWGEAGEYPNDRTQLIRIVHKVCYENAMGLFANLLDQNL
ncbi:MAG: glucuronate isomerase, partial [Clostridia bacterium]